MLIFSRNLEEHKDHIRQVLQRLLENPLYVKVEKLEFHVHSITFLGFILEGRHVKRDPVKTQPSKAWPTAETRQQLQQFLGFANFFCTFI